MRPRRNTPTTCTPSAPAASHVPLDKVTFGVAAALVLTFLLWGALDSEGMASGTGEVLAWLTDNFGWMFILVSAAFLIFSVYLAVTRYGNIKLGPDDSTPEFSTFSWVSMMFATGMGIGLMFWGVAEPLTYLTATDEGSIPPGRAAAGARPRRRVRRWSTRSSTGACTRGRCMPSSAWPSATSPTARAPATSCPARSDHCWASAPPRARARRST